jgi:phage tail sheath gpL-like
MGIDKQSEQAANLQIGPTSLGMVRIYVEGDGVDLPLDFDPDEAEEIAEELQAAAAAARAMGDGAAKGKKKR